MIIPVIHTTYVYAFCIFIVTRTLSNTAAGCMNTNKMTQETVNSTVKFKHDESHIRMTVNMKEKIACFIK